MPINWNRGISSSLRILGGPSGQFHVVIDGEPLVIQGIFDTTDQWVDNATSGIRELQTITTLTIPTTIAQRLVFNQPVTRDCEVWYCTKTAAIDDGLLTQVQLVKQVPSS